MLHIQCCVDCFGENHVDKMHGFDVENIDYRRSKYGKDYGALGPSCRPMRQGFTTQLWRIRNA